jgi:hypothetical protein
VADQWPSYLAYLASFSTIGAVWIEHMVITEYLDRATSALIRLNLLLLIVVTFLPFPTRLLGEHIGEAEPERVAVTIYGLNLFLASALVSVLWQEVSVVRAAMLVHELHPAPGEAFERGQFARLDGVVDDAGDHPRSLLRATAGRTVLSGDDRRGPARDRPVRRTQRRPVARADGGR